jgi:YD repeat-containing protein
MTNSLFRNNSATDSSTVTYNSLSQLLTATNPESGAITYTYDNDGNVLTKTDARNVTTTYTYDPLNRNTQKSYSDGTPTANFYFDAAPSYWAAGEQNTVGRLVEATTSNTATEFSYDPMGRIAQRVVCAPINCTVGPNGQTGQGWAFANTYNFMGGVTQFNDGIFAWPQYFNQTYDGANRVTQVTSTASDAQHPASFFTADSVYGFFPHGALRKAALGDGPVSAPPTDTGSSAAMRCEPTTTSCANPAAPPRTTTLLISSFSAAPVAS